MHDFKTLLEQDLSNVFFNSGEFAEIHTIAGVRGPKASPAIECEVVVDRDLYIERKLKDSVENVTLDGLVFFIKKGDWNEKFGSVPKVNRDVLLFDGTRYLIEALSDNAGILEFTLTANRG